MRYIITLGSEAADNEPRSLIDRFAVSTNQRQKLLLQYLKNL